ncbi:glycosyltransferase family 4 protein [Nonomuraea sp. NPDC046570]|uniref:glycosyltransferase family 4 protein n=1 Tax=Nonomuraea sp. NPDC046570 TaxID=3155255 RepID=UPI0033F23964
MVPDASPPQSPKVSAKSARAGVGGLLRGFLQHPVIVSRVVAAKVKSDPVRVAQAAADALPPRLRPVVGKVAWPAARKVRHVARKLGMRVVKAPWNEAKEHWDQGRVSLAAEVLQPHTKYPFVKRRAAYYEGELAAISPDPIPPQPKIAIGERVQGRVLHCVTNALPYTQAGYTVRTHRIVTSQKAAGLDPHVVTSWGWPMLQGHADVEPFEELDGIPYYRLLPDGREMPFETRGRIIRGAEGVTNLVERLRPQVLHAATDHRNGSIAHAVRARTGTPFVYEVRGFLEETWASRDPQRIGSQRHLLQRDREAFLMREADAVVTLAETMAVEIVERGVPRDKIYLAPNAVDDSLLTASYDGAAFRRSMGIGDGEIVVGSVSSIVAYEGFATLLRAAALMRDQGTPVRVLIVGDGTERENLLELVDELRLTDAILPGRVGPDEALQAQEAIDIFVCPREDLRVCRLVTPLKPVEAMALGKPVVLSDLPALSELVGSDGAGLLVPPGDPAELAKALAGLREDPARRQAMGEAGKAEVAAKRTWGRVAETYREIYRSLTP